MNERANNRRVWVKNALIIFLAIMLILTFFSNTIMNYSLPEVAAQYAMSGSITSKIRTTATIKANSTHKIRIDETRNILAVAVKDGDMVEVGDVLFYLKDAESVELKNARDMLESLEKQYRLKLLTMGVDYYSDELAISLKREELLKAQQKLSLITNNEALIESLNEQIKQLTSEQKTIAKQITAYQNQISKLKSQAAEVSLEGIPTSVRLAEATQKYEALKLEYEAAEALKEKTALALEAAENAYEKANEAYEALNPDSSVTAERLTEQINALNKEIRRYKEDYQISIKEIDKKIDDAYDEWINADYAYNNALYMLNQGLGSQEAVDYWFQKSEDARLNYESIVANQKPAKDAAKLAYDRKMEDYTEQLTKLENQLAKIAGTEKARKALDDAAKVRKTATNEAKNASEQYDKAKMAYSEAKDNMIALEKLQLLEECEAALEELEIKSENIADQIADKNEEKQELSGGDSVKNVETQKELIKTLTRDLETLEHNLNKKKLENQLQNQRDQIEIDELLEKIDEQRALVEKYEANSVDAKILATVAGQVTAISAVAGSDTSVGQTLCEIVVTDLGYSCEINLTNEQSKRVRVGDEVSVTNAWWSNIKGSIVSLRNDPKNPGNSKIATIAITGNVVVGQSLNLTIGERGQNYDTIVPNSAIREDNNGKFVLVVEAKSSPLGNRYIAKRCDVTVLASDDTNSAVSGLLGSEFIITTSTKPITSGNQVRLVENSR
jgi:multidrug efflux pump subunit AcrA (membrane-fusion protein)